ncbi:MAG: bifunctional lysylphosphatidylglycerol flippase/synthetase MprF [Candidatus Longimicrobiales bacterium M2_2A_002]
MPRWRLLLRGLVPFVAVALFVLALVVLHRELAAYGFRDITSGIRGLPATSLLISLALTTVSFVVLAASETLAVRWVDGRLGYPGVAFTSFVGHAFSQALGAPLPTSAPVRYRLYSAWDLSTDQIARIGVFRTATTVLGLLAAMGGALLLLPAGGPVGVPVPAWALRSAGLGSLGIVVGYAAWTCAARSPLRVFSWEIPLPSPRLAAGQIAAGAADWLVGAGVLYVLLPPGHGLSFLHFTAVFAVALSVGQISLVPGGLGVFEAALLLLLPESVPGGALVASLVAYRAIYYLLPLVLASVALAGYERRQPRRLLAKAVDSFGRGVSTAVPLMLSALVFVAGAFMLVTGALPAPEGRLAWLGRALPLPIVELSHLVGSLVGALLLILAWGLRQRLDAAYRLTVGLLALGAVLSAVRGPGWIEAAGLLVTLAILLPARREFFRKAAVTAELPSRQWAVLAAVVLAGTVWLGLFVYRRVDLTTELWWQFTLRGDAPRFLRASIGAAVVLLGYGLSRLLRPRAPGALVGPETGVPPQVDAVVEASGRAHGVLVYLGDKQVLLSESGRAFVMFAVEGRSWVALGDPLGDPEDFDELIWRFRKLAYRHAGWPVFYQARPDSLQHYADIGLGAVKLGEEAYVPLDAFTLDGPGRKGLRRTVRRVEDDGATFEILPRNDVGRVLPGLRDISDAWLEEKKSREKGFSLGFFTEKYLLRTPVAVLRVQGSLVAFANVLASGSREELSADLMRYAAGAPPSAMEYLFVRLMLWGAEEGYDRFSLGMAPLAGLETRALAPFWNRVGAAVFRYGEHFYNFRGLRAYKEKFDPIWEPRYLVSPGGLAFPRILANLATLVGGGVRGILTR